MNKTKLSSGAKWEQIVGYSRLVKFGPYVELSGTTAVQAGKVVGKGDANAQAKFIIELCADKLKEVGCSLEDVIRTRIYVTNIEDWEAVGRAHGAYFGEFRPATSLVEVSALIDPDMLVEIEMTAIAPEA